MKKILDSGAELEITLSDFAVCHKLLKATMQELQAIKINFLGEGGKLENLLQMKIGDEVLNTLKDAVLGVFSSVAIEDLMWKCMERSTYDGVKIDKKTFESEAARGDFLIVAKEVLWFNLRPFLKNLGSMFSILRDQVSTKLPA